MKQFGTHHHKAKLNDALVCKTRLLLAKGIECSCIAEILRLEDGVKISRTVISDIKNGKLWRHVNENPGL